MTDPKLSADRFWSLRDRAEKRLRETPGQGQPQRSDALLHRIELELQNEDLLRANRQLEALRDSYRKLFDFAPLAYCLLDRDGLILDANLEAARLLGVSRALLPGTHDSDYLAAACRQAFIQHRNRVFELGVPGRCELRLVPRGGAPRLAEIFLMALDDPAALSRRCLVALTDITERRQAEEHSLYLASIVEFSRDAIIGVDLTGHIMGRDIKLSEERIEGYRHFVNKLWNAARFVLPNLGEGLPAIPLAAAARAGLCHAFILSRLERLKVAVAAAIEGYQFNEAAQELYTFFWREFCDWYLEMAKVDLSEEDPRKQEAARQVLHTVLSEVLVLLHPIMARAAWVSSSRPTGRVVGQARTASGLVAARAKISSRSATKASSVCLLSVSVGSIMPRPMPPPTTSPCCRW